MPTIAAPVSGDFTVGTLMSVRVPGSVEPSLTRGTTVKTAGSPGWCLVTALATASASATGVPSTATIWSPACSRPSAGAPAVTAWTISSLPIGMPSWLSAAVRAWSSESANSSAFCRLASASDWPFGYTLSCGTTSTSSRSQPTTALTRLGSYLAPVTWTVVMLRWPLAGYDSWPVMVITGVPVLSCTPSVLYVGPGLISVYGTFISTEAQSSAMSSRVAASIVAERRGMPRHYGTRVTVRPAGRRDRRAASAAGALLGAAAGGGALHRGHEPLVLGQRGRVTRRSRGPLGPTRPHGGQHRGDAGNDQPGEHSHLSTPSSSCL